MRKFFILSITLHLLLTSSFLIGQNILDFIEQPEEIDPEERILLAVSNNEYSVTPGDIYQLSYQPTEEIISLLIQVEIDCSLNLGVLGKVEGKGLTFTMLKQKVEKKFSAAYPQSTPSLTINALGMFQVFLTGEVPLLQSVNVWGLTRLSDILINNIGPYSSIRDIKIKNTKWVEVS